jgi:hypothetical protein
MATHILTVIVTNLKIMNYIFLFSIGSMQASTHSTLHGRCINRYSYLLEASQKMVLKIQIIFDQITASG